MGNGKNLSLWERAVSKNHPRVEMPVPHGRCCRSYFASSLKINEESVTPKGKIIVRLPAPLIAGGIWFLSSQSTLPQPKGILGYDKFQHLLAYLILAAAISLWISPAFRRRRRFLALLSAALIASVYGVIDEIHQSFTPGRDCDVWDWLADTLGAFLGAALMTLAGVRRSDKAKNGPGAVL